MGVNKGEETETLLDRYLAAQTVFRRYAPKATVGASMLFTLIARRTLDRGVFDLPTPKQMADALDASPSSISHLLSSLTAKGRTRANRAGTAEDSGYGLIEADDNLQGRRLNFYVLTPKGRVCLQEMVQALAGDRSIDDLTPHDSGSLFRLLIAQAGGGSM